MTRSQELANPNSCFNKAADDELMFVLLERDPCAPAAIRAWVAARLERGIDGVDSKKIVTALAMADEMENPAAVCDCGYPRTMYRNGSGHDEKCPVHLRYLKRRKSQ
jgi:hypothetical protein